MKEGKKMKIRKLLSGLIIVAMVAATSGIAFAADGISGTETPAASAKSIDEEAVANTKKPVDNMELNAVQATAGNNIVVTTMTTGNETPTGSVISYNTSDDLLADDGSGYTRCGYSKAVKLNKGTVIMAAAVVGNGEEYYCGAVFGIYKDKAMTSPVDGEIFADEEDTDASVGIFTVPAQGTYYIGVYSPIELSDATEFTVGTSACYISGVDRTLSNKKQVAVGQKKAQTNYFTFKAPYTGYIKVDLSDKANVTLMNSSKKALSNKSALTYSVVYGVKKGVTYKIRIQAPANKDGYYLMKVTNVQITEKSGSSKSKAVTIKRGATKKGNIIAGSSTADWYKFTLTSSKKVNVVMKGATNNKMKISIYKGSKLITTKTFTNNTASLTFKSNGKLTKGTYYIKIYRGTGTSSGYYSCYWKYR